MQAALDDLQLKHPRTTLTVAHRLLTVKDCDKIAFMGDGGVLEVRKRFLYITFCLWYSLCYTHSLASPSFPQMGTHDELLALKSNYYELWQMQNSEEELEEMKK